MKPGDLVYILGSAHSEARIVGTLIQPWRVQDWWEVLLGSGRVIHWPETQMVSANEDR